MIVVTGSAGFIGSCLVAKLNELNRNDLVLVDHFETPHDESRRNLENKKYASFIDKWEFLKLIQQDRLDFKVETIFHMGACSSTIVQDADYFQQNNYLYSVDVAMWAKRHNIRMIYASSAATYGDGNLGYDDEESKISQLKPLNLYGDSKQRFDQWVINHNLNKSMVGLKFFNVFGPNEYHKGDMRSVIAKSCDRVISEGKITLFKSYNAEYKDGEQKRDFVYVKDVVEVMLFFMNNLDVNGIFNVATGNARTWNDLAAALFSSANKQLNIEYVEMPEILRGKYQYFTEGNISKLRKFGYHKPFLSLEEGIDDYLKYLVDKSIW